MYKLADYIYDLPEALIAQQPSDPADSARLLVPTSDGSFLQKYIIDLPSLLDANTVMFLNDTRVVPARIPLRNIRVVTQQGREVSLDQAEIFFLYKHGEHRCEALISLLKRNRPWTKIFITEYIIAEITALTDKWVMLEISGISVDELMNMYGQMPLPPYITPTSSAQEKYQTVFAKHDWSVAAPTASLHLTQKVMEALQKAWVEQEFVTLHVGLGTFKPVDTADIREYQIHEEDMIVDCKIFENIAIHSQQWKIIMAVWTTVARVLETLPYVWVLMRTTSDFTESIQELWLSTIARWDSLTQDISLDIVQKYVQHISVQNKTLFIKTQIFIYPWFHWKIVQKLMTNFHLPWSTLLMMIASFIGYDEVMKLYMHAVINQYRFFSFWDAMLLHKKI